MHLHAPAAEHLPPLIHHFLLSTMAMTASLPLPWTRTARLIRSATAVGMRMRCSGDAVQLLTLLAGISHTPECMLRDQFQQAG
jgi:hypothetical protein